MSTRNVATRAVQPGPNQAAHRLLTHLIDRVGLTKRAFLDQLADLGYPFSDDDFANWGRPGRSFPRSWAALRAMVQVVTQKHAPQRRCTAAEALQFLGLTGMPFPELSGIIELFELDDFSQALAAYIPSVTQPPTSVMSSATAASIEPFHPERMPPKRQQSDAVGKGLSALAELLWEPAVRDAVVSFRTEFEVACKQVGVLADYKQLHDLFQQFEDRYYLIYHDYKRLPDDGNAWAVIERNEPELQAIADELLERLTYATVAADAAIWRQKLIRIVGELRASVENNDIELLRRTITLIKDLLGREPSRINTRLVSTASTLRLGTLIRALSIVRNTLSQRDLGPDAQRRFAAFEHGLEALARLHDRLGGVIATHNAFQEVDDEFRRMEALLEQDASELAYAWQSLRPMVRQLCGTSDSSWSVKLEAMSIELEGALMLESMPRAIRMFRACRSQASRSFNQVDRDLLGLCEELRQIGEPLATVLKMIA